VSFVSLKAMGRLNKDFVIASARFSCEKQRLVTHLIAASLIVLVGRGPQTWSSEDPRPTYPCAARLAFAGTVTPFREWPRRVRWPC
jgi:hypothetical protein